MQAEKLYEKMSSLKYGWYDHINKRQITPRNKEFGQPNFFEENCYILKPNEVWKYGVGTCWDFTILEYQELSKSYDKVIPVYFEIYSKNTFVTHSSILYQEKDETFSWFEFAWGPCAGIHYHYADKKLAFENIEKLFKLKYNKSVTYSKLNFNITKLLELDNITAKDFIKAVRAEYREGE